MSFGVGRRLQRIVCREFEVVMLEVLSHEAYAVGGLGPHDSGSSCQGFVVCVRCA